MHAGAHARWLDLVAPGRCAACRLPGPPVCAGCLGRADAHPHPRCRHCDAPHAVAVDRCRECRRALAGAHQAGDYAGVTGVLVRALKDHGRRDLADPLARLIAARCPPPPPGAVLVPVPLTARRRRERGFNQSDLLAARLADLWGLTHRPGMLERARDDPPQRGASRSERERRAAGAFHVPAGVSPPPCVWLVDDVHTTGSTLAACAAAMRHAGCHRVGAVAAARAMSVHT